MWMWIGGALLAGLVGSPHCVGMCGGFAAASAAGDGRWTYHLGRLGTYGTLGALAGAFGQALPVSSTAITVLSGALTLGFAAALAGLVKLPEVTPPGVVQLATRLMRASGPFAGLGLGAATALLPCGLVYATLGLAVAAGGTTAGAATMVVFGLGTVPVLAGAGAIVRGLVARGPGVRRAMALLVLLAGWGALGARHAAALATPPGEAPACHAQAE